LCLQAPRRPNGGLQPVSCHGRLPDWQTFRWLAACIMLEWTLTIIALLVYGYLIWNRAVEKQDV
jgi:hypothetical protein